MIEIRFTNGETLDLAKGTRLSFELVSPFFTDQVGYGSQSFQASAPMTPKNMRNLNRRHLFTKPGNSYNEPVRIYIQGAFFAAANLRITQVTAEAFRFVLDVAESALARTLANRTLKDFAYGGTRVISTASGANGTQDIADHALLPAFYDSDTFDYCFPTVENPGFYNSDYHELYPFKKFFNFFRDGEYQHVESGLSSGDSAWMNSLVPFFFVRNLMRYHTTEAGLTLTADGLFALPEWKNLCLYNTVTLDSRRYTFVDPTLGTVTASYWEPRITPTDHLPEMAALDFWKGILRMTNSAPVIVGDTVQIFPKKFFLIFPAEMVDWTQITLRAEWVPYAYTKPGIYSHTPDEDDAGVYPEFTDSPTYVVDTTASLPGTATRGETTWVWRDGRLYRYDGTNWNLIGRYKPVSFRVSNDEAEVKVPFDTLPMIWDQWSFDDVPIADRFRVPLADQPGNSEPFGQFGNPFGPRLLFWHGMQAVATNTVNEYPYASSDSYPDGFLSGYSLWWQGDGIDYGVDHSRLYEWHEAWRDAMAVAKQVNAVVNMSPLQLRQIDWRKKYRIRVYDGEVQGLLKRVTFSVGETGMDTPTIEIVTL